MDKNQLLNLNFSNNPEIKHVTFLGLHNADRFRVQIESWLPMLDFSGNALLVADNDSLDNTRTWMSVLLSNLEVPVLFIRNQSNLGGYGSLFQNLSYLTDASWITMLHQDDLYTPEHIQEHRRILLNAPIDLGLICTEAVSFSTTGRRIAYPRGNWLIGHNPDVATVFLGNLRNHFYPFSGATIRREVLERFPLPIPSQAFPDTEIVLKMCPFYKFAFAEFGTVSYLENPDSESHSLSQGEREIGTAQALIRVFRHESFRKVCLSVGSNNFHKFVQALDIGISSRFEDEGLKSEVVNATQEILESVKSIRTVKTGFSTIQHPNLSFSDSFARKVVAILKALSKIVCLGKEQPAILQVYGLLPRKIQIVAFKLLMKNRILRSVYPQWNFDWKR
jgi:hypothetical protein